MMPEFTFITGYTSERVSSPAHCVPAVVGERSLGHDGAVTMDAEHHGIALCGRLVSDVMPRVTFETIVIDQHRDTNPDSDEFSETARWPVCVACADMYEVRRNASIREARVDG